MQPVDMFTVKGHIVTHMVLPDYSIVKLAAIHISFTELIGIENSIQYWLSVSLRLNTSRRKI